MLLFNIHYADQKLGLGKVEENWNFNIYYHFCITKTENPGLMTFCLAYTTTISSLCVCVISRKLFIQLCLRHVAFEVFFTMLPAITVPPSGGSIHQGRKRYLKTTFGDKLVKYLLFSWLIVTQKNSHSLSIIFWHKIS